MRSSTASAPELLAAYDEQVRRRPVPDGPDDVVEHADGVVRCVSATGWSGVTYSDLAGRDADAVIAAQLARMTGTGSGSTTPRRAARPARPAARRGLRGRGARDADGRRAGPARADGAGACPASRCARSARTASRTSWPCTTPSSAATTAISGASCASASSAAPPSPSSPTRAPRRSRPPGWSSSRAPTSPACGATRRCPTHRGRGSSARWSPARAARVRARLSLPAGRRDGDEPPAVRAPGLRRARDTTPFIWRGSPRA